MEASVALFLFIMYVCICYYCVFIPLLLLYLTISVSQPILSLLCGVSGANNRRAYCWRLPLAERMWRRGGSRTWKILYLLYFVLELEFERKKICWIFLKKLPLKRKRWCWSVMKLSNGSPSKHSNIHAMDIAPSLEWKNGNVATIIVIMMMSMRMGMNWLMLSSG